jgi:hypothetical protein
VAKMFDHVLCFLSQSEIGDFDAIILSRKLRFIRFKINRFKILFYLGQILTRSK